jgi:hypothetical protein
MIPTKSVSHEQHEQDEDHEDEQVGPLRRDVALCVRLREAEDEAAGHRARDRADPADHRSREPLETGEEADRRERRGTEREEHAGGARERRPEHEREHDHAVDVDPHHRGRLAVVRRRLHRLAGSRPGREHPEQRHQHERRDDDDDPQQRHADVADVEALEEERAVVHREGVVVALLGAEEKLHRVGEEERDA